MGVVIVIPGKAPRPGGPAPRRNHQMNATPAQLAQAHAAQLAASPAEADFAYIRRYLFTYGYPATEDIYGEALVRAAMLPTD